MGDILERFMEFLLEDETGLGAKLEPFFQKNASMFENATTADDEQKLEYMDAFNEYIEMMDSSIDEFCAGEGTTAEKLMEVLREAAKTEPDVEVILQLLLAKLEYSDFFNYMKEEAADFRMR